MSQDFEVAGEQASLPTTEVAESILLTVREPVGRHRVEMVSEQLHLYGGDFPGF